MKNKPAGTQLILVICVALVSLFIMGLIGTIILASVSGIKLTELSEVSKMDFSKPSAVFAVRGMQLIQFISLFLVPSFIAAWIFSENKKKYLGLVSPSNLIYFIAAVAVMLVALPLVSWLGEINRQVKFPVGIEKWMKKQEDEANITVKGLLSQHSIKDLLLNIVFISGLAAVGEELLFRGVAQRLLIKVFKNPWAGIIIAAALFSALHIQFYGFLPRFVLGILLGAIYWYSGSLWVAILGHFMYDAVLIVLAYKNPDMLNDEAMAAKATNLALVGLVSTALVTAIVLWMKNKSTTTYNEVYADDAIPYKNHPFDFENKQ